MSARPRRDYAHSLDEIRDMLTQRIEDLALRYAPEARGSYTLGDAYYTLNPGRADTRVGSFWINLTGPWQGRWIDKSSGQRGGPLDLIMLSLGCDMAEALREARVFLGLASESPAERRQREIAMAEAEQRRQQARASRAEKAERVARQAHAIWLSARADLEGTPVDLYLRGRGIDMTALPRPLTALRYLQDCYYKHVDPETGEIFEGRMPAMLATAVDRQGRVTSLHRTYLGLSPVTGRWGKADVPQPKKVMGPYSGASIRLWAGLGPKGGHPGPLAQVPAGSRAMIAEGIEDGLIAALALPAERVLAAISLVNLGRVELPKGIAEVTLIGDRDEAPEAQAQLQAAVEAHRRAGRRVRLWLPPGPGDGPQGGGAKDLNDRLRQLAGGAG